MESKLLEESLGPSSETPGLEVTPVPVSLPPQGWDPGIQSRPSDTYR